MAPSAIEEAQEKLSSWQRAYENDTLDLERSEKVTSQLRAGFEAFEQKANQLEAESQRLFAKFNADPICSELQTELAARRVAVEAGKARRSELEEAALMHRRSAATATERADVCARAIEQSTLEQAALKEAIDRSEARTAESSAEARSMVTTEALQRVESEAARVKRQLDEQQVETASLRQALADSWAARADPIEPSEKSSTSDIESLEQMEKELEWLAKMQRTAADERHHVQKLERSEAALQAKLREASEEKASLQSTRVDLADGGKAMREAIAHQSEGYIRRLGDLEAARRFTDGDRTKLCNELAAMQEKLDAMAPELASIVELETRHRKLDAERQLLDDESQRLRLVNGALGAQVLGDDMPGPSSAIGGGGSVADAVTRVLQVHLRLTERMEAHTQERHKLTDRIRQLEKELADSLGAAPAVETPVVHSLKDLKGSKPGPEPPGALASATSGLFNTFANLGR